MNSTVKTPIFWVFVLIFLMLLWGVVQRGATIRGKDSEIAYSDLLDKIGAGKVQDVVIQGTEVHAHLIGSKNLFYTTIPDNYEDLTKALLTARVSFTVKEPLNNAWKTLLLNSGPVTVLLIFVIPPFWEIFKKAGFKPMLSVLMLVPLANLVMIYIVGFSEWKTSPEPKS